MSEISYEFDPTASKSENHITHEVHTISPANYKHYHFIIPYAAPFYTNGLVVRHYDANGNGEALVEGVDFFLGHFFHEASQRIGREVYGSINFYNHELVGSVDIDYRTMGGPWVIDQQRIEDLLSSTTLNPRITRWAEVVDVPEVIPAIAHDHDVVSLVGMDHVAEQIAEIATAVADDGVGTAHIADKDNPHETTKYHVELGNLQNYPFASEAEMQALVRDDRYVHPVNVATAIQEKALKPLNQHIADKDNPHETTKEQLNLGLVENHPIANKTQAETGENNETYMTPLRTTQAVAGRVDSRLDARRPEDQAARSDIENDADVPRVSDVALGMAEALEIHKRRSAVFATYNSVITRTATAVLDSSSLLQTITVTMDSGTVSVVSGGVVFLRFPNSEEPDGWYMIISSSQETESFSVFYDGGAQNLTGVVVEIFEPTIDWSNNVAQMFCNDVGSMFTAMSFFEIGGQTLPYGSMNRVTGSGVRAAGQGSAAIMIREDVDVEYSGDATAGAVGIRTGSGGTLTSNLMLGQFVEV